MHSKSTCLMERCLVCTTAGNRSKGIQHHPTQEKPRFLRGSQRPLQGSVRLVSTTRRDQSPEAGPESTWFSFGPKPSATCRQRKRPCQQWTRPETCNFLLQIKQFEVRPFEAAFLQTTCDVCLQLPTYAYLRTLFLQLFAVAMALRLDQHDTLVGCSARKSTSLMLQANCSVAFHQAVVCQNVFLIPSQHMMAYVALSLSWHHVEVKFRSAGLVYRSQHSCQESANILNVSYTPSVTVEASRSLYSGLVVMCSGMEPWGTDLQPFVKVYKARNSSSMQLAIAPTRLRGFCTA